MSAQTTTAAPVNSSDAPTHHHTLPVADFDRWRHEVVRMGRPVDGTHRPTTTPETSDHYAAQLAAHLLFTAAQNLT